MRWYVSDPANVLRHGLVAPAFTAEEKLLVRGEFCRFEKQILYPLFAVGQSVSDEGNVTLQLGVRGNGMMRVHIEPVVDAVVGARAELQIGILNLGAATVGENGI